MLLRALGDFLYTRKADLAGTKFGFQFDADGRQVGLSSRPDHIKQAADPPSPDRGR